MEHFLLYFAMLLLLDYHGTTFAIISLRIQLEAVADNVNGASLTVFIGKSPKVIVWSALETVIDAEVVIRVL